jgi:hypothetical protein
MVEVFKTDVHCHEAAALLVKQLLDHLPPCSVNFDLDDCDKILRIEGHFIPNPQVIAVLNAGGYSCEVLA